jgi:transposase
MYIKIKLDEKERQTLLELAKTTKLKDLYKRAQIILFTDEKVPVKEICKILNISEDTVEYWKKRYLKEGIEGLATKPRSGRPLKADNEYISKLKEVIIKSPSNFGYAFNCWSLGRLSAHLKKETGISISESWLSKILHREGFSFKKPVRTLKNKRDKEEYEDAKKDIEKLKKNSKFR